MSAEGRHISIKLESVLKHFFLLAFEECVVVYAQCFASAQFPTVVHVPSYSKWVRLGFVKLDSGRVWTKHNNNSWPNKIWKSALSG